MDVIGRLELFRLIGSSSVIGNPWNGVPFFLLDFVEQGFTCGHCGTSGSLLARAGAIAPADQEEGQSIQAPVPRPFAIIASGPRGRSSPCRP